MRTRRLEPSGIYPATADMTTDDIVHLTTYLAGRRAEKNSAARRRPPSSTLYDPAWLAEIEVIAAA